MKWFWAILIGILILMIGIIRARTEVPLGLLLFFGILMALFVFVIAVCTGFIERK